MKTIYLYFAMIALVAIIAAVMEDRERRDTSCQGGVYRADSPIVHECRNANVTVQAIGGERYVVCTCPVTGASIQTADAGAEVKP